MTAYADLMALRADLATIAGCTCRGAADQDSECRVHAAAAHARHAEDRVVDLTRENRRMREEMEVLVAEVAARKAAP